MAPRSLALDVVVTRGPLSESRHRVHAAVVDLSGSLVASAGDPQLVSFWRSCAKPLQTLPLVRAGGLEQFGWGDEELALTCGSHGGEPEHVALAARMLASLGLDESNLACGPDRPLSLRGQQLLDASGNPPTRLHHNCSGKHSGMLARATIAGWPVVGYQHADHPVQREARAEIAAWAGLEPDAVPVGVDGCGVSVFGLALTAMAFAYARLGDALVRDAGAPSQAARAMVAKPFFVGGTGIFDTVLCEETSGRIVSKVGAEGVYSVMIPGRGLGLALKVEDGAGRALYPAVIAALRQLGELDALTDRLAQFAVSPVVNTRGETVGEIKATS